MLRQMPLVFASGGKPNAKDDAKTCFQDCSCAMIGVLAPDSHPVHTASACVALEDNFCFTLKGCSNIS
eukprot:8954527-Ditylum_brightwellii.AAC.1